MADQRTMAELLRAPTEGYAKAIFVPPILAEHFELKHSLINLVTSKQFFGFEKEDPHAHIRYFNKITSTLKYKDVPETSIKLMLFPFSIDGLAQIWLDKEPSRSILTWDDLAWDRFKDLLRAYLHHGFAELHQLDTFYNGLNPSDQDSLNFAATRNLLERSAQVVLKIIENKSKVRNSRNKPIVSQEKEKNVDSSKIASAVASAVTSSMTVMFKQHQVILALASIKAVEESCVTCGSAHSHRQCPTTNGNTFLGYQDNIQGYVSAAAVNYNHGNTGYRPQSVANQFRPSGFAQLNVQNQGFNQNQGNNFNQGNTSYQALIQQTQVVTSSDLEKFKKTNEANMQAMRNHINGPFVPMPPLFINSEEDERAEETLMGLDLAEYTIKVPPPLVQNLKLIHKNLMRCQKGILFTPKSLILQGCTRKNSKTKMKYKFINFGKCSNNFTLISLLLMH
uniref:Reverse transcriptase domain-containing protein n=1 Tax=Tanacetum cinerariifolium TaxID=118510 RepID=A0A699H066_TANCI|nr:hypothetical protein [Tanacetum cinerariifolium]